ncbi:hypothetical protein [Piscinibacter terrae]|uniref:Uncharacterized protein n=1 Tax=Piscinibacter terrae TaxID=2496871 RepID=A0A3N7HR13_9BURK|nr:hypothetical protein [Albitalea terrae]RQP24133.1 hypothetical protein DZC73_12445 [Albitalea terrae]
MIIVWGKKHVRRSLGYVADFCPICRRPSAFNLRRVGLAGHVYYISLGEGDLVGHERTCKRCDTPFEADPGRYRGPAKKLAPLKELIAQTFPDLGTVWRERIEFENQLQQGSVAISSADRPPLILSPFLLLSPKVERQFATTHLDKEVGFAFAGLMAMLYIVPAIMHKVAPDKADDAFLFVLLAGVLLVLWQVAMTGRRFMRREIAPVVAQALRPLKPRTSEMSRALDELRKHGHKIGRKLKVSDIEAHLKQPAPRPETSTAKAPR